MRCPLCGSQCLAGYGQCRGLKTFSGFRKFCGTAASNKNLSALHSGGNGGRGALPLSVRRCSNTIRGSAFNEGNSAHHRKTQLAFNSISYQLNVHLTVGEKVCCMMQTYVGVYTLCNNATIYVPTHGLGAK